MGSDVEGSNSGKELLSLYGLKKVELAEICRDTGIPFYGKDLLKREFSLTEQNRIERAAQSFVVKRTKMKKRTNKPASIGGFQEQSISTLALDHGIEIAVLFELAKKFGFAHLSETEFLTTRQYLILMDNITTFETIDDFIVSIDENGEKSDNNDFSLELAKALLRHQEVLAKSSTKIVPEKVISPATFKRLKIFSKEHQCDVSQIEAICKNFGIPILSNDKNPKIELGNIEKLVSLLESFQQVQSMRNDDENVRISKIGKLFKVKAADVFTYCVNRKFTITSERFISRGDALMVLIYFHMNSKQILENSTIKGADQEVEVESETQIDYSNISLTRQNISNHGFNRFKMEGVDFSHSVLTDVTFVHSNLDNSRFLNVNMTRTDFSKASLKFVDLKFSRIVDSALRDADLLNALFCKAEIVSCDFSGARLENCDFSNATLDRCDFKKAIFLNTTWINGQVVQNYDEIEKYGTK